MSLLRVARRAASTAVRPLKVGVVGAGAIGCYFGARLAELGHDVRFLLDKRPAAIRALSWQGDAEVTDYATAATPAELGDDLDWVVVALKATALEGGGVALMERLVAPAVGPDTRVQLLMNGLGAEEACAAALGSPARVHGGLVYGGLSRDGLPGEGVFTVRHDGVPCEVKGGSFVDDPAELERAAALWTPVSGAKPEGAVAYTPQGCLRLAQWSKLAWNIPFNGGCVAAGGCDVGALWRDADGKAAAVGLMREVCAAANADLAAHGAAPRVDEAAVVEALSAITDTMAGADYVPSTTKDFINKDRMEVGAIFEEPLRRALAHGVDVPRLQTLTALLRIVNDRQAPPGQFAG